MHPDEIAKTIRYFRKQSGLSQQDLAELAGIGKTVVFDVEKGKASVQLDTLLKILGVLNIRLTLETPFAMSAENEE
jgi:HTH-type transcriptional regulator / antitoxin HipB